MVSLFQFLSTLIVLLIIVCTYIGYNEQKTSGKTPTGLEAENQTGWLASLAVWIGYSYTGLVKLVVIVTELFKKKSD